MGDLLHSKVLLAPYTETEDQSPRGGFALERGDDAVKHENVEHLINVEVRGEDDAVSYGVQEDEEEVEFLKLGSNNGARRDPVV